MAAMDSNFTFVGLCLPPHIWYETLPGAENATLWRGIGIYLVMDMIRLAGLPMPKVNVKTKLDKKNALGVHPFLAAVATGDASFVPLEAGVTYSRFKHVDYTGKFGQCLSHAFIT